MKLHGFRRFIFSYRSKITVFQAYKYWQLTNSDLQVFALLKVKFRINKPSHTILYSGIDIVRAFKFS